jgi:hypothetical protein
MELNLPIHKMKSRNIQNNNQLLPSKLRALFTGPSGSGKTQRLVNMLLEPKCLDYNHLILFTPTLDQQFAYHLMSEGFNKGLTKEEIIKITKDIKVCNIDHINDTRKCNDDSEEISNDDIDDIIANVLKVKDGDIEEDNPISVDCYTSDNMKDLPKPEYLDSSYKHILVADDCMCRKDMMPIIHNYFTHGRHYNVVPFYLNQKFVNRDPIIRRNANMLVLFNIPDPELK